MRGEKENGMGRNGGREKLEGKKGGGKLHRRNACDLPLLRSLFRGKRIGGREKERRAWETGGRGGKPHRHTAAPPQHRPVACDPPLLHYLFCRFCFCYGFCFCFRFTSASASGSASSSTYASISGSASCYASALLQLLILFFILILICYFSDFIIFVC